MKTGKNMFYHTFFIVLVLFRLTIADRKSARFVAVKSRGDQDYCAVNEPTAVKWFPTGGSETQCGLECMKRMQCRAFNFNSLLGKCDQFETPPSNYDVISGCKGYAFQMNAEPCLIRASSWGTLTPGISTAIKLNDNAILGEAQRGFTIIELDVCNCLRTSYRRFDTHNEMNNRSESTTLANYINGLPTATVLVGVTADEPYSGLEDAAKNALHSIGVDVSQLRLGGCVTFVAQIGRPAAALTKLGLPSGLSTNLTAAIQTCRPADKVEFTLVN